MIKLLTTTTTTMTTMIIVVLQRHAVVTSEALAARLLTQCWNKKVFSLDFKTETDKQALMRTGEFQTDGAENRKAR